MTGSLMSIHHSVVTPAAELLHGKEKVVNDNAGCQGIAIRAEMAGKTVYAPRSNTCSVLSNQSRGMACQPR
jgi:hypothetical protein